MSIDSNAPTTSSGTELRATVTRGMSDDNTAPNPTTPAAKYKHVTGQRILSQLQLHDGGQTVESLTHVSDTACEPDTRAGR